MALYVKYRRRIALRQVCAGVCALLIAVPAALAQEAPPVSAPKPPKEAEIESLFYTASEVDKIHQAMNAYLRKKSGQAGDETFNPDEYYDQASEIKQSRAEGRYFTYPQFFLESLVFRSDIDWTIWVNGQKITPDSASAANEIRVVNIGKGEVTFEWQPHSMEKVNEVWGKWPNDQVVVNGMQGTVGFTLHPNQTFSSYVMRVLEGKVMPVTIDNQYLESTLPVPPPTPANGNQPVTPEESPPADPKAIIGLYENTEEEKQP